MIETAVSAGDSRAEVEAGRAVHPLECLLVDAGLEQTLRGGACAIRLEPSAPM